MDLGTAAQWVGAVAAVAALILSIRTAISKRSDDALNGLKTDVEKDVAGLTARLEPMAANTGRAFARIDAIEQRVSRAESELAHLPSKDAVHELRLGQERLEGELKAISASLRPVAAIGDRLQEFLLEQAAKR